MSCHNCGATKTIKAHLIPRAFCVEIQEGKSHAALVTSNGDFKDTQSGVWDRGILCSRCDGFLGRHESYAIRIAKQIRAAKGLSSWNRTVLQSIDIPTILRFCGGILYKYSLTNPSMGRIELGPHQGAIQKYIFDEDTVCPAALDALILRPLRFPGDNGQFAYRAPRDDRIEGLNIFRMMMGGLIFFVKVDRRGIDSHASANEFIKQHSSELPYVTVDALQFEEYRIPATLVRRGKLSTHLDRINGSP